MGPRGSPKKSCQLQSCEADTEGPGWMKVVIAMRVEKGAKTGGSGRVGGRVAPMDGL